MLKSPVLRGKVGKLDSLFLSLKLHRYFGYFVNFCRGPCDMQKALALPARPDELPKSILSKWPTRLITRKL